MRLAQEELPRLYLWKTGEPTGFYEAFDKTEPRYLTAKVEANPSKLS